MPFEPIGIVAIGLGLLGLRKGPAFAYTLLLCSMLLGAAAAMILPGVGSIQPGHLMLGLVLVTVLARPDIKAASKSAFSFPSPGFWLAATCAYGVLSAFFFPRLLAGRIEINALSTSEYAIDFFKLPLKPTNGNITQSVYFIGDVLCFAIFYGFASLRDGRDALLRAFLVYGTANIFFAVLDLSTSAANASWLLEFMRNSTYIIYADSSVGDVKRIIGSFSEAAAFAYATVGISVFSLRLWLGGVYPTWSFVVGVTSLGLLLASTSSTAYVALAPSLCLIGAGSLLRSFEGEASAQDIAFQLLGPLIAGTCGVFILLNTALRHALSDYLANVLFAKALSSSGIDRSRLNKDALDVFWDTRLIGAGLGSIRTSSFVLAVLGNLGLVGSIVYATFLATLAVPRGEREEPRLDRQARSAARCGCFGLFCAATASGTLTDLGLPFFALAAFAVAPSRVRHDRRLPAESTYRIREHAIA